MWEFRCLCILYSITYVYNSCCPVPCINYNVYGHSGLVFKYAFLVPVMCLVYVMALKFLGATKVSRDGGSSESQKHRVTVNVHTSTIGGAKFPEGGSKVGRIMFTQV